MKLVSPRQRDFLVTLWVTGGLWFLVTPFLVVISPLLPKVLRHRVVAVGTMALQSTALCIMCRLFLTRSSDYYKVCLYSCVLCTRVSVAFTRACVCECVHACMHGECVGACMIICVFTRSRLLARDANNALFTRAEGELDCQRGHTCWARQSFSFAGRWCDPQQEQVH
jgi:hypothetical protein